MNTYLGYHGANGDNVLKILTQGQLVPRMEEIYFSIAGYAVCFPHGADTKRMECYSLKLLIHVPLEASVEDKPDSNVQGAKVIKTPCPVKVDVQELYVRAGAATFSIRGMKSIEDHLTYRQIQIHSKPSRYQTLIKSSSATNSKLMTDEQLRSSPRGTFILTGSNGAPDGLVLNDTTICGTFKLKGRRGVGGGVLKLPW